MIHIIGVSRSPLLRCGRFARVRTHHGLPLLLLLPLVHHTMLELLEHLSFFTQRVERNYTWSIKQPPDQQLFFLRLATCDFPPPPVIL